MARLSAAAPDLGMAFGIAEIAALTHVFSVAASLPGATLIAAAAR
ncbi:hypothetical protein [Methylocystis bryophila]|nr:hypothetical protein [Methylocystis bryophila]